MLAEPTIFALNGFMQFPNRIRELREARGLTQEELAAEAGTTSQQIGRLERGARSLRQDWMERIAAVLGVTPAELLPQAGEAPGTVLTARGQLLPGRAFAQPDEPQAPYTARTGTKEARPAAFDGPRAPMVPLYAAAIAGDGETLVIEQGQEIEYIPAGPAQLLAREAFSIRVHGESMEPRYRHGQVVDAVKHRPPVPGQGVVIELENGAALLKEFKRWEAEQLLARQYNPDEPYRVDKKRVTALHAVVGTRE